MKKFVIVIGILLCLTNIFAEGVRYLIITHNNFYNAIQPLKEWKHKKGMTTKIVRFAIRPTREVIKDSIRHYQPEYVLLVGSRSFLPPGDSSAIIPGKLVLSDNYYSDTIGDYIAELAVGRFPCLTADECNTMVLKIIGYERNPFISDTSWYKKGAVAIRFDSPGDTLGYYVSDMRFATICMRNYAGFVVDSLFWRPPGQGWHNQGPDSARHIVNAINNGRGFILFRGMGQGDGQYANWIEPMNVKPESTNNGYKLPIIFSGACSTLFSNNDAGVGEAWLRKGSSTNQKGAIGFIGNSIHRGLNIGSRRTHMICGFFKAVFVYDSLSLGHAFLFGKDSLFRGLSSIGHHQDSLKERYVEWSLLGDPELNLWTAVPKPMLVTHEKYISPGQQSYTVNVRDASTQNGIANALVCVMMPNDQNVYHYGYTNGFGNITFNINPTRAPDSLWVTVTVRNYRPYEGKCDVIFLASEHGTFPNQGCHLVREPNTSNLHMVYENNARIYYSMSTDWGQTWSTPTYVDTGECPAIALSFDGNTPWIFYADLDLGGAFRCAVRRPDGTWKIRTIFEAKESKENYNVGPSLVMATLKNEQGDLGYAVFSDNGERIFFVAFDTIRNYGDPPYQLIDEHPCQAPSIAVTPADLIHVVWQRNGADDGKIFYKTTLGKVHPDDIRQGKLPEWSREFQVSDVPGYPTEPASNPSVEAYGEFVYVAWRGPNYDGRFPGDIWRRARKVWAPPEEWLPPENKSETRDNESNYPVMSTDFVTVWQESIAGNNWNIWGRFEPEPYAQPFFQTDKSSKYPHINGYRHPEIGMFLCSTIWTEEIEHPLYEIKFGRARWIPKKDVSENIPPYYTVEIGDSTPSPYCTHRDGYFSYGQYAIDYGHQKLKYKLPYLHPSYYYDVRAIVYQQTQNNWSQKFDIDSALTTTLTFEPNRPETVWIRIPQQSYENDAKVKQEIRKILGNRAVIADLRLYQVEEIDTSGNGGGPQSADITSYQRPLLYQSYPNPFKSQAVIRYSLPNAGKVSLQLYDISGRLVKTLIDEYQNAGSYSLEIGNWKLKIPNGVYFYRLKTDNFSDTKRLVLIR